MVHPQGKLYIDSPSWYIMTTKSQIEKTCDDIKALLLSKNEKYGDSALNPVGVFSKLNSAEAIKARIDDKLSRIANVGLDDTTEDTLSDLIGYLVLLKIAYGELNGANSVTFTNLKMTPQYRWSSR